MTDYIKREITKEQYDRAMKCGGYISKEDEKDIFSDWEIWGYGVYGAKTIEEDGVYYVRFQLGSSCD